MSNEITSQLKCIQCPICDDGRVTMGAITKLCPVSPGSDKSYAITILPSNKVIVDDKERETHDFRGNRMALSFKCGAGHHWTIMLVEHDGTLVTTNPIELSK